MHSEGGAIFAQLAHSGAVSHPDFFDGELPPAPSAVNPGLKSFTPRGFKDTVTPRAMSIEEIASTVADYGAAAKNAHAASFDGVELHAATTYLLPEFLNSVLNIREDAYGGTAENRARIVLEVLDALIAVWGPGRVGIKISPTLAMGGFGPTDKTIETYDFLVGRLNGLPLSHLQVGRALNDLSGTPPPIRRSRASRPIWFPSPNRSSAIPISCDDFARACRSQPHAWRPTTRADRRDMSTTSPLPERDNQQKQTGAEPMTKVTERTIAFVIDASSGIGDRRATAHHQRHNDIRSRRDGASQAI